MNKVLYITIDKEFSIKEVSTNEDVRRLLHANIGDLETIYLSSDILLFYNFNKIEEIGHMTGRIIDKDGYLNFVCGDLVVIKINGSNLDSLLEDDIVFVKSTLNL